MIFHLYHSALSASFFLSFSSSSEALPLPWRPFRAALSLPCAVSMATTAAAAAIRAGARLPAPAPEIPSAELGFGGLGGTLSHNSGRGGKRRIRQDCRSKGNCSLQKMHRRWHISAYSESPPHLGQKMPTTLDGLVAQAYLPPFSPSGYRILPSTSGGMGGPRPSAQGGGAGA